MMPSREFVDIDLKAFLKNSKNMDFKKTDKESCPNGRLFIRSLKKFQGHATFIP